MIWKEYQKKVYKILKKLKRNGSNRNLIDEIDKLNWWNDKVQTTMININIAINIEYLEIVKEI